MSLLFRPSEHDRQALQSAVKSLRETSVAGLAAALSWKTRKVERLLVDELTRPGTMMAYDPARRVVRWVPPVPVVWNDPPASVSEPAPAARPAVDLGPTLAAPPLAVRSGELRARCPTCHVPLVASASASLNVCPQCGRLHSSRAATSTPEGGSAPSPGNPEPTERTSSPTYGDRRSQELLAAYVSAQPIPCPRCQTPLRHRGVSEYGCPSCGETVRFAQGAGVASVLAAKSSSPAKPTPP